MYLVLLNTCVVDTGTYIYTSTGTGTSYLQCFGRSSPVSMDVDSSFVYQQKEERGEFLVKLFYDKELDLCNWGPNPKFAPR